MVTKHNAHYRDTFPRGQTPRRGFFSAFANQASRLFRKVFKKKKIVIISDKKIVSIPITISAQVSVCLAMLVAIAWMSYSSGRYLMVKEVMHEKEMAFQQSLNEKEKELSSTNMTNKDLLSQVTDLQRNLLRINSYFEHSLHGPKEPSTAKKKENKSDKNALLEKVESIDVATSDDVELLRKTANETLYNIDIKIRGQIKSLEKAVALTGLELEDVSDMASLPDIKSPEDFSAAGGPYFSDRDKTLTSARHAAFPLPKQLGQTIDYLLQLEEVVYKLPLSKPMAAGRMTSHFGKRTDPIRRTPAMHYGLDFAGPAKAKIYATAPGIIRTAKRSGAYGNLVEIDHGNGITTRYGHMSKILVRSGTKVKRGDVIGLQGSTGRSTGAHLHYEVRYNNIPRNPRNFIKAGDHVFSQRKG